MGPKLMIAVALLLAFLTPAWCQSPVVALRGQLVCSECWFEADRSTTPYGSEADIKCAVRCAKAGMATALAVTQGGKTTLYLLEEGEFKQPAGGWVTLIPKQVELRGRTRAAGEKSYVEVDALKVLESPEATAPTATTTVFELILRDLAGAEQRLSNLRGQVVVLNFWATWCGPCRAEMPVFAKVQSEYGPLGVQVVAASVDVPQARPAVEAFVKQQKLAFPVWVGATPADMERAGVPSDAIPVTVLIDRDGTVKEAFIGRITEDRLTAALGSMVGNPGK